MAAAKRVVDKSESLNEIYNAFASKSKDLFNEIDNWSARIHSLQKLDTIRKDFYFSDISKFLEIFNFLSGEYALLYHGKTELDRQVSHKRDGYSHDFLGQGHLTLVGNRIKRFSKENPLKHTMRSTYLSADLNFGPKGTDLVDGLNLLKEIINELKEKLPKNNKIFIKSSNSSTPCVFSISDGKTMQYLDRYESIDFEQRLKDHPWSPVTETQAPRKKQKKDKAESSIIPKKQQYPLK